jgi:DNA-binding protein HU-beta
MGTAVNKTLNKSEFIEALSGRLGDSKTSAAALDAVVGEIERCVSSGDKVNITGFGVFERRERAARTGRNPRTGEPIRVAKSTVPAFRPGASFKDMVSGNSGSSRSSSSATKRTSQPTARASQSSRSTAKASSPQASARGGPQAMARASSPRAKNQARVR